MATTSIPTTFSDLTEPGFSAELGERTMLVCPMCWRSNHDLETHDSVLNLKDAASRGHQPDRWVSPRDLACLVTPSLGIERRCIAALVALDANEVVA